MSLFAETEQLEKALELGSPILARLELSEVEDPKIEELSLKLRKSLAAASEPDEDAVGGALDPPSEGDSGSLSLRSTD